MVSATGYSQRFSCDTFGETATASKVAGASVIATGGRGGYAAVAAAIAPVDEEELGDQLLKLYEVKICPLEGTTWQQTEIINAVLEGDNVQKIERLLNADPALIRTRFRLHVKAKGKEIRHVATLLHLACLNRKKETHFKIVQTLIQFGRQENYPIVSIQAKEFCQSGDTQKKKKSLPKWTALDFVILRIADANLAPLLFEEDTFSVKKQFRLIENPFLENAICLGHLNFILKKFMDLASGLYEDSQRKFENRRYEESSVLWRMINYGHSRLILRAFKFISSEQSKPRTDVIRVADDDTISFSRSRKLTALVNRAYGDINNPSYPLWSAIVGGRVKIAEILLEAGADWNVRVLLGSYVGSILEVSKNDEKYQWFPPMVARFQGKS